VNRTRLDVDSVLCVMQQTVFSAVLYSVLCVMQQTVFSAVLYIVLCVMKHTVFSAVQCSVYDETDRV
jgi:hypothetical protein